MPADYGVTNMLGSMGYLGNQSSSQAPSEPQAQYTPAVPNSPQNPPMSVGDQVGQASAGDMSFQGLGSDSEAANQPYTPTDQVNPDNTMHAAIGNSAMALNDMAQTAEKAGADEDTLRSIKGLSKHYYDLADQLDHMEVPSQRPDFQSRMEDFQDTNSAANQHRLALEQQLDEQRQQIADAKLDPNHYFHSRNIWQNLAGALGVALGAYGSAVTGTPSAALQLIQSAVDRDWEAQKETVGKLFKLHEATSQDLTQLTNQQKHDLDMLTGSEMGKYDAYNRRLAAVQGSLEAQLKSNPNSPVFKANLEQTILGVKEMRTKIGLMQSEIFKNQMTGYKQMMGQPLPEQEQTTSSAEQQAYDTIQRMKDRIASGKIKPGPVRNTFGHYVSPDYAAQDTDAQGLKVALTQTQSNGGRSRQLFDAFTKEAGEGNLTKETALARLDQLSQTLAHSHNTRLKNQAATFHMVPRSMFLPEAPAQQAGQPDHAKAIEWARKNPQDPRASKILKLNGLSQ